MSRHKILTTVETSVSLCIQYMMVNRASYSTNVPLCKSLIYSQIYFLFYYQLYLRAAQRFHWAIKVTVKLIDLCAPLIYPKNKTIALQSSWKTLAMVSHALSCKMFCFFFFFLYRPFCLPDSPLPLFYSPLGSVNKLGLHSLKAVSPSPLPPLPPSSGHSDCAIGRHQGDAQMIHCAILNNIVYRSQDRQDQLWESPWVLWVSFEACLPSLADNLVCSFTPQDPEMPSPPNDGGEIQLLLQTCLCLLSKSTFPDTYYYK